MDTEFISPWRAGRAGEQNFVDALPMRGSVSGSVTTSNGAALAGVTVYVDIDNSNTFDAGDPFTTTGASR